MYSGKIAVPPGGGGIVKLINNTEVHQHSQKILITLGSRIALNMHFCCLLFILNFLITFQRSAEPLGLHLLIVHA
jgi:hypothetical protein